MAITPDGVLEMARRDVPVVIEEGAGSDSGISDDDYRAAGAELVASADAVWQHADLVLKVKEPQRDEFRQLRPGLVLFTYLHLAAYPDVAARSSRQGPQRSATRRSSGPTVNCRCSCR